jgi:hypothetical protein
MSPKRTSTTKPVTQLVDAVMECYLTWREQNISVDTAYTNWTRAPAADRESTFAVYLDALDREEQAAAAYERLLAQTSAALR